MLWLSWMTYIGEVVLPPLRSKFWTSHLCGPAWSTPTCARKRLSSPLFSTVLRSVQRTCWRQHRHGMANDTLHDNINIWFVCTVSGLSGALPSSKGYWFRTSSWHLPVDDAFSWTGEATEIERDSECRGVRLHFTSRRCIRSEGFAATTHRATKNQLVRRRSRSCAMFCRCLIRKRLSRKSWKWYALTVSARSPVEEMGMPIWSVWPPSGLSSARPSSFPQAWPPPRGDAGLVSHKPAAQWDEHHHQLAAWSGKVLQCEQVWSFSVWVLVSRQNQPATTLQSQSFCCEHVFRVFVEVSVGKDLLLTGLQRRPGADKRWRRDSVCSRCQPSKIEMRSGARQWRVIAENNSKEGNWHLSPKKKSMRAGNERAISGAFGHLMSVFLGNSCLIVYLWIFSAKSGTHSTTTPSRWVRASAAQPLARDANPKWCHGQITQERVQSTEHLIATVLGVLLQPDKSMSLTALNKMILKRLPPFHWNQLFNETQNKVTLLSRAGALLSLLPTLRAHRWLAWPLWRKLSRRLPDLAWPFLHHRCVMCIDCILDNGCLRVTLWDVTHLSARLRRSVSFFVCSFVGLRCRDSTLWKILNVWAALHAWAWRVVPLSMIMIACSRQR